MRERREPLDSRGRWHSEGDPCRASGASPVTRHPVLLPAQGVQTSSWRFAVQTDIAWPLSTRTAHCHTPRTPRNAGTFVSGHHGTRMACHGGNAGRKGQRVPGPPRGRVSGDRPGCGRSGGRAAPASLLRAPTDPVLSSDCPLRRESWQCSSLCSAGHSGRVSFLVTKGGDEIT